METSKLKKFAQYARRYLMEQVSAKLGLVLAADSAARRESPNAVQELERKIRENSRDKIVERVAYTWFNRFCALRFMDVNRYTRIGIVSPAEGQFQPEILAEAKMGHIDEDMVSGRVREKVSALLNGKAPSKDPQAEAYQLLIVGVCNYYHKVMPFLFERIADYTELLMPDDLLSGGSVLAYTREALTPQVCEDVEVIGWLYQFYISEKKDEVIEGLKKNKKITPENIPAATQLFTPNWIVRFVVENSLGRLWMLNRPNSQLVGRMDYYIKPEEDETGFLRINSPEEIKVCDPACGSGHMLVYAFDLLHVIYEEEGYEPSEIPGKILTQNLYGIEIDERAGELAAFALTMKAQSKHRRFLRKPVQPNICVLENIHFKDSEINAYLDAVGRNLFTTDLQTTLHQFEEADNFGSLIRPALRNVKDILRLAEAKKVVENMFLQHIHERVLRVLMQADFLSPKYHVVITNPPYMGGKGMNPRLKTFAQDNYKDSKSDLFAMFIERLIDMLLKNGFLGIMSPFTWMFLSSYEKLRNRILNGNTLTNLVRPEYHAFFDSAYVPICAFTLLKKSMPAFNGAFIDLNEFYGADLQPLKAREAIENTNCGWFFRASAADFKSIPGSPIVYWVSERVKAIFSSIRPLSDHAKPRQGLVTGDNNRFLRYWFEPSLLRIGFGMKTRNEAEVSNRKWFPCQKGGGYRKWYGNHEYIVNWENDGVEIRAFKDNQGRTLSRPQNMQFYFFEGITWSTISSSKLSMRYSPFGFISEHKGSICFTEDRNTLLLALAFMNAKIVNYLLQVTCPTLDYLEGPIGRLPFLKDITDHDPNRIEMAIELSESDWNEYETSWGFKNLPLLRSEHRADSLKETYASLSTYFRHKTREMQQLEQENNSIFIKAYGLHNELTQEVPLSDITLTCNPCYRYGNNKTEEELEFLLSADTMKEFISYAVGCMFGRYSLDKPGLVLANQGETIEDYLRQVPNPTFPADRDNVIPMLDGDWFPDDISERFRKFLRVTFGEEHYEENLKFLEGAIGKDIRKYFLKDFYSDHVKRYKKRPIYWLFSSPKGTFNALIYMHRYRPDTVSIVLNDYLREFRTKLAARKSHLEQVSISGSASQSEKTKALKEIEKLSKMVKELEDYEREVLYPLATEQVEIDLDDGVKVNYCKFGAALKKIPGLDAKEED
jgi:type II restriction/modification system DNA methylase subunit YeeA